jgi:mono/diheme cytochrome c family protein
MKRMFLILISGAALAVIASTVSTPMASDNQIERGKYLVMHVAMCVQCHTPRTEQGELDEARLLQGAPMPVKSPFPSQTWAFETPKIAGLPGGWTETDLIRLLQIGKDPRGESPQPPMPPFRMTKADATAIAMYLKSLQ